MKTRPFYRILYFLTLILGTLIIASCEEKVAPVKHSIMVLHSWEDNGEEGEPFRKAMERAFREKGINAEIHHAYLNAVHTSETHISDELGPLLTDSLKEWNPEVILVNDDPLMDWIVSHPEYDDVFNKTPTVFAGVNLLQRDSLYRFTNMSGFEDKIDLPRNLDIYKRVTGRPNPAIEIDFTPYDLRMREYLYAQISDTTRYINDYDFRTKRFDRDTLERYHPGAIMVNFLSAAEPESNCNTYWRKTAAGLPLTDDDLIEGKEVLGFAYSEAERLWQIQVKYDIFSNSFIDRSRWTQFTCIREQFNDSSEPRLLCGHFTSMQTQVEDQVAYATTILLGTEASTLPIEEHKKGYYLDYNALARYKGALSEEELLRLFEVVNMPFYKAYPSLATGIIALATTIILLFFIFIGYRFYKWFRSSRLQTLEVMKKESWTREQLFKDTNSTVWVADHGMITLPKAFAEENKVATLLPVSEMDKMIHDDTRAAWNLLVNHRTNLGRKRIRIKISFDKAQSWHWYEVNFNSTEETSRKWRIAGLFLNIDDIVAKEEEMKEAHRAVNDIELKESFLANISHDLRTPLNAVTGFSNLLTMSAEEMPISDEERKEFCEIIHQNSEMMLTMIDNVVDNTIEGVADIKMKMLPRSVKTLVAECFRTNAILAPSNLAFKEEQTSPDCNINIDIHRTKQVINNFISNSFKFTADGEVVIGWRYVTTDAEGNEVPQADEGKEGVKKMAEIYVRDTGVGISEDAQKHLFDRFYKVKEADKGTGLGLNISQTIIQKQNGTIGVKSVLGEGSTFFIRLDILPEDKEA